MRFKHLITNTHSNPNANSNTYPNANEYTTTHYNANQYPTTFNYIKPTTHDCYNNWH
jgi:hypothetical protein